MTPGDNIFLIGPMGAGKSTIGRQLARELGWAFLDSDQEIERRTGASIPLIFDVEGEAGFRQREAQVIDELTRRERIVLATGGGAVLDPANRAHLKSRGIVIFLSASLDQLYERTARDRNRPLLQTDDPRARLQAILAEREPLYRDAAEWVIESGRRSVRQVVRDILRRLQKRAERRQRRDGP
ncbi:MAG TPA: shikimate kinase AroK [Gammaproteobacteria bacterium]|nr:shikimate kinase AroK [Gammaproteobacteria bacterium]